MDPYSAYLSDYLTLVNIPYAFFYEKPLNKQPLQDRLEYKKFLELQGES